jgi:hypothetical protein
MAIDSKDPSQVSMYPKSELPKDVDFAAQNIFFTAIDREAGILSGYHVISGTKTVKLWQLNVTPNSGEKIHHIRSQHQTASEIDHQHYLPTAFVGDNLIYKYLDSNLFAVSTLNMNTLSVMIVNGVSGKVVYKFSIDNISTEDPIDMILQENQFILSYKRQGWGIPQQELSVTEFFSSIEETDTVKLLKDVYLHSEKRPTHCGNGMVGYV